VPIYIALNLIGKPFMWINQKCDYIEAIIIERSCCFLLYFDCGDFVCALLLWILYQPRALIFAVFISPIRLAFTIHAEL
jgi:hypothetical protein